MNELPKAYNAKDIEQDIYTKWEESGYFNPDVCVEKGVTKKDAQTFSLMMPPPNVTGILHLGHALENSIMDIEVRFQRMMGKKTLWIPGTDHAAVATQAKVEALLMKDGMKNPRKELGREKLLEKIREYAEQSKTTILEQIKKMGSSCDWSRLAYTFDETRSKAVNEMFVRMYNDGLIYQGYRVINWSVKGQSTCSDDELESITRESKIYTFKYSKDFPITIATTRPETKLGDTAVAVHPEDSRYKKYIGKTYTIDTGAEKPLEIKIIGDDAVDPNYGTGALGVTPAHSLIDFEIYERHDIKLIQVIGTDGKMMKSAGKEYQGLTVEQARAKFVNWLKENDLLEKEEVVEQNVSISDRFKDIIEAIPMTQWFVAVNKEIPGRGKTLKDLMRDAMTSGHNNDANSKIKILPERFNKTYFNWIDNLRDWCISRQIWWGHQIPVWYKKDSNELYVNTSPPKNIEDYTQDPDTLDTWFSSGTWTFSTLGWPENTNDLSEYHTATWMQMGYEILFFWMARMILMSTYALDQIPFKEVYIHGMLRDKNGQKFSKSLGNGLDPIDIIKDYGTDALRLTLISNVSPGNDSRFYNEKVEYSRNVINKLWNISRYILTTAKESNYIEQEPKANTLSDQWILNELNILIENVGISLENKMFSQASDDLQAFTWHKLADWYLEISKIEGDKDEMLLFILQNIMKLWHPFTPFITEHIWSMFTDTPRDFLMVTSWPKINTIDYSSSKDEFEFIQECITKIRNIRSEKKIAAAQKLTLTINSQNIDFIKQQEAIIKGLTRCQQINYNAKKPESSVLIAVKDTEIFIHLEDAFDSAQDKERITKEIGDITNYINSLEGKLNNEQFVKNAPENIINAEREKLSIAKDKLEILKKL